MRAIKKLRRPDRQLALKYTTKTTTVTRVIVLQKDKVTCVAGCEETPLVWCSGGEKAVEEEVKIEEIVEEKQMSYRVVCQRLVLTGGKGVNQKMLRSVEDCLDSGAWVDSTPLIQNRWAHGAASIGSILYVCGGEHDHTELSSVMAWQRSGKWIAMASMGCVRSALGVAVLNGYLYAVGGFGNQCSLTSMEVYDPTVNEWFGLPAMSAARYGLAVAALDGLLYVCGGHNSESPSATSSNGPHSPKSSWLDVVEVFDPEMQVWEIVPPMPVARYYLGAAALGKRLYVAGGKKHGDIPCAEVYSFDPSSRGWRQEPSMHYTRSALSLAVVGGRMYAVGGQGYLVEGNDRDATELVSCEVFDPDTREWTVLNESLAVARGFAGLAVL